MSAWNAAQIAEWNGVQGQRWAQLQAQTAGIVSAFGTVAIERAAPQAGERVIDVGCGCGDTSIELARRVGATGAVLGLDVSRPMLEVARARSRQLAWAHLAFREADASEAVLPDDADLLYSRFGVMFFGQPVLALRHLRLTLKARGRCVFVCWRAPRDNPWAMAPLVAARKALGVTPAPVDPDAPGPFAFADEQRVRGILSQAGYANVELQRFDAPVVLGPTPRIAAESATQVGPTSRLVRDLGADHLRAAVDAIEGVLEPLACSDGQVSLNGSSWIVFASNP